MPHVGINMPAEAGGALGGAWQQKPPRKYTVVMYEAPDVLTIVVYDKKLVGVVALYDAEEFYISDAIKMHGVITKRWKTGNTTAYRMRIDAASMDKLLNDACGCDDDCEEDLDGVCEMPEEWRGDNLWKIRI
ncbi:MAG: hypothetical protein ACO2PN_22545 [Pyrobaculum sp.]